MVGTLLIGYGAEYLDANTKRKLAGLVVKNASQLIDKWTISNNQINFTAMKDDMTSDEFLDIAEKVLKKVSVNFGGSKIKKAIKQEGSKSERNAL